MREDIKSYLDSKGIENKIKGKDIFCHCPHCNHYSLSISMETGLFRCWDCANKGRSDSKYLKGHISQLKEEWGDIINIQPVVIEDEEKESKDLSNLVDRYHHAIKSDDDAMKYLLKTRRISENSIDRFKLGVIEMHNQKWISIPSYEDGIPVLLKYGKVKPYNPECKIEDKYIREKGGKSVLFNADEADKYDTVFVAEGELDCITLVQQGFDNTVGMTSGAAYLGTDYYDMLIQKEKIYLCMDPDSAGQVSARNVWASRLGVEKCYNVLLPNGMDVNDFFIKYTREDFEVLLNKATRFKVDGIASLDNIFIKMYKEAHDPEYNETFLTPWDSVNRILDGGLKRKRLLTLAGNAGVGKTTLVLQILYHISKEYNIPTLLFCVEMPDTALATKIVQIHKHMTKEEVNWEDALAYRSEIGVVPIYFGYSSRITPEQIYETIKAARNRYGIEVAAFDNLQRMVRTGKLEDLEQASGMFKDITMDLNMPFILVCQPRKINSERELIFDDIRGARAIADDADEIILLHRKRIKEDEDDPNSNKVRYEPTMKVTSDKSRYGPGGFTKLNFIGVESRFEEIPYKRKTK